MSSSKTLSRNCAPIASIESLDDEDEPNANVKKSIDADFEYKNYHKFGRILGKGSFGTVIECVRKHDQKPIALKFFKRKAIHKWIPESIILDEDINESLFKSSEFFAEKNRHLSRLLPSEVACLLKASKINGVVKILDYIPASEEVILDDLSACTSSDSSVETELNKIHDESIIGIVLERDPNEICLFDYLIQNNYLEEDEARVIMKQLVQISLDLLQHGILHGDLKSENILINPVTKQIKVIDFGSAQIIDFNSPAQSNRRMSKTTSGMRKCNSQSIMSKAVRTFRGTNLYKPPEFILHHCFYPRPSTVWTFGVILYDMVCGHFPFDKDSDVLTHQDKEIEFTRPDLSDSFKDLVKKCLAFYVADRIVIEKVLNHSWMNSTNV